ncbi:MAG: amino acid adenylation domain-containing protein [Nitrospiraceae bacterium]|nr:MAG: amino acid adenylation domain-containing protein [Nitrospiraceae bacterium]
MKINNYINSIGTGVPVKQSSVPPIIPVSRRDNIPLSFAQQRLWMHEEMEPDIQTVINYVIWIDGHLRLDVLQKALDAIIQRHEILRTTYSVVHGEPVQIVHQNHSLKITQIDLDNCPAQDLEAAILSQMEGNRDKLFDLSTDLMLRVSLLRLSDSEYLLHLSIHHIAADEQSLKIFSRELLTLYEAFAEGRPSTLPDLPVQYADFSYWRRQQMTGEILERNISYWKNHLAGSPAALDLPSDRPRPSVRSFKGASHTFILPETITSSLKKLSEHEGVSMSTLMMAAFKVLLYRYTDQGDICAGTFTSTRNMPEIHGLIGFFVNMLVFRTDLSDAPSFRKLLHRESEVADGAYRHYDMPFEMLVEALNPQRDLGRSPLFQVAFAYDDEPDIPLELPGLKIEIMDIDSSISLYDLSLLATQSPDVMKLTFVYSTDLFNAGTIQRFADNFTALLKSIVLNPEVSISALPILSDTERKMILEEWSGGTDEPQSTTSIHELFEAQVERTPDAVAVVFEDQQLTYLQLNNRANQLAHYLRKLGVGPEMLVGICEERSLEMVVGLLGILKSGGAYVPLDPDYPQERLNLIVNDTKIPVLLTHSHLSARISLMKGKVVLLDSDWNDIARESEDNPPNRSTPDNAACIFYTSGSTGTPKGAVIQHGALVHFTKAVISQYGLRPSDRVLQFASINFDASAEEIYPCLAIGSTLVLRTNDMLTNRDFLDRCDRWKLTVLSLPTAYWHILTQGLETENLLIPSSVRLVIIGGERALPDRLSLWQQFAGPRIRLLNTYGPTEATVVATLFDLTSWNLPGEAKEIPIGRPTPNTKIYILDTFLQPVPVGVPGELYIGGNSLAREYLNRADITSEKFIPNPFENGEGSRLYKTGDLARYLPDSLIEFIGRIDHQVKIRGFRIELGEIESRLRQHPAIKEAVVVAREERPGERKVVGYVVPRQITADLIPELRVFLAKSLPDHMNPSAFVMLNALPLTPNNKIDLKALPAPERNIVKHDRTYMPPRNSLEMILTKIWEKVLDVRPVGIRDNFFEIGGHSLLAVRLISEIKKSTGKNFPVISIFQSQTVERLAELFCQEHKSEQLSPLNPFQPAGSKPPLFWVYGWQCYSFLSQSLGMDQPFYGFFNQEKYGRPVYYNTIEEIAALYLQEMRDVQLQGPYFLGGYCFGGMIALEMAQQLCKEGNEVPFLFLIELPSECLPADPSQNHNTSSRKSSSASRALSVLKKLIHFSFPEKAEYISKNTRFIFRRILSRGKNSLKTARCMVYAARKQPLPYNLRHFYLMKLYANAINNYTPRPYPGKVILIRAEKGSYTSRQNWSSLASGGVEIHTVQRSGHMSILEEPYIETWAGLMKKSLDSIHEKRQGNQS